MGFNARQKSLTKAVWELALPAIVTNLTTPLLGLCDVAIAGHKGGAPFIASLAVATSMFNMLYWMFGFLRMGSSGLTAQAYGANDRKSVSLVLARALSLGMIAGILMLVLQDPLGHTILRLMDVDPETSDMAMRYFSITVWGAPAVLSTYSLTGWYLGMQNSKIPMMVSIIADIVNIAVSVVLVFVCGMHIEGVAFGTLTAQWLMFSVGLAACVIKFRPKWPSISDIVDDSGLTGFFRINIDIFLRTICLIAVTMWFTRVGAGQGELMLAVNALLMQLFTLFSYFMDGFAFSAEALVGRYIGAHDRDSLHIVVKIEVIISISIAMAFTMVYFLTGDMFLSLLTDDMNVAKRAHEYLPWAISLPLFGFLAFIFDGITIGATATRLMLVSMAVAMALFFAAYSVLFPLYGNHGLWIAFLIYLLARGIVLLILTPRRLRL